MENHPDKLRRLGIPEKVVWEVETATEAGLFKLSPRRPPSLLKVLGTALGFFLAAALIAWFAINGGTYTIVITQQEAQQQMDVALAKRALENPKLAVSDATVAFVDDHLILDAHVMGFFLNRVTATDIHITGSPNYRSGSFYFYPNTPIEFNNTKISKTTTLPLNSKWEEDLRMRLHRFAEKHDLEDLTNTFKKNFTKWASTEASPIMIAFLDRHPVYTMKNDYKGLAVRAIVSKVQVVDSTLHVTLSVSQLGYSILLALVCICVTGFLLFALFNNPELLMIFEFLS